MITGNEDVNDLQFEASFRQMSTCATWVAAILPAAAAAKAAESDAGSDAVMSCHSWFIVNLLQVRVKDTHTHFIWRRRNQTALCLDHVNKL